MPQNRANAASVRWIAVILTFSLLAIFALLLRGCLRFLQKQADDGPPPKYTTQQAIHVLVQRVRLSPEGVEAGLEPDSAREGETFVAGCDAHRGYGLEMSIDALQGAHVERIELDYCFDKYTAAIKSMNTQATRLTVIYDQPLGADRYQQP